MSGSVRIRRAPSPLPGAAPPNSTSQRYPPLFRDNLDPDERRDLARLNPKNSPPKRTQQALTAVRLTSGEWKLLAFICVLAAFVRLFRLSKPDSVVFDEVHFGKFAGKYIKTQYYVDVHPPLAKLLITLAAFIGGFDGQFDFKDIAKPFENVPYILMRLLPATLGVGLVPLTYLTLRGLECRATTALLGSLLVTFENGLVTQSRLILLDSPLLFFTGLSTFLWVSFSNENDKGEPFSRQWWIWLTLTGLSLGAVVSCKWVGLFTIATIGLATIKQLWDILGDLKVPPKLFFRHFMARALCLIVVPILFYMAMFEIHFLILENSGDGDGFMSSEFQHTLGGRKMADTYADVGIGSRVTIRHLNTQGGYLHSHPHNYPGGSKQQQITLYPHRDSNNEWLILNDTQTDDALIDFSEIPFVPITNGMRIRLHHASTERNLHSHDVRPPISEVDFQNEVSAYGYPGFMGDANDHWIVELEEGDRRDRHSFKRLRSLRTKFRLRHIYTGCYLFSHKVKLPEWGFEQQEVTCNKNAVRPNSLWYIETNEHPALPPTAEKINYKKPGFLSKFLELQQVMWTTNAGLTERHTYDSRPSSWPRLLRGINFWVKDHRQIYLLGNPIVWWLSTAAVIVYASIRGLLVLRAKRGYQDFNSSVVTKYEQICGFLAIGWALHYFPFFIMQRQLFLHHYFPALYFAILLFCGVFDLATSTLRPRIRLQIAVILILISIITFWNFSSLAYGTTWTRAKCRSAQWLRTWDFACHEFYDDYSQYAVTIDTTPVKTPTVTAINDIGRGPVVVEELEAPAQVDSEHTTSIIDKVEPGRDLFAQGGQYKNAESKEAALHVEHEVEEPKQIKSVFKTEIAELGKNQDDAHVFLPDDNDNAVTGSLSPPHESKELDTPLEDTFTVEHEQEHSVGKMMGPLDNAEAEEEEARQKLYPQYND